MDKPKRPIRKVYLAGKITGNPIYASDFDIAEQLVKEKMPDCVIIKPSVLPLGMTPADYMRICFSMLDSADAIVLLSNYTDSKGAMLEKAYAEYTGKAVIYMQEANDE